MKHKICNAHKTGCLHNLAQILRRRRTLVFSITFLGFSLSAFYAQNIQSLYTAKAQLVFEGQNAAFIKTQQAFITSPRIVNPVIHDIGIDNFMPGTGKKDISSAFTNLENNFFARHIPNSYLLNLEYRHPSPHLSSKILNEIIEQYLDSKITLRKADPDKEKILAQLRSDVENALDNLEKYKNKQEQGEYETLGEDLKKAELEYAKAKERIDPFLDPSGTIILNNKYPEILNSKTIAKLNLERIQIEKALQTLSYRYGPKHPEIIDLRAQFLDIHTQLKHEKRSVLNLIRSQYEQASSHLQMVKKSHALPTTFDKLKNQAKYAIKIYTEYENLYKTPSVRSIASTLRQATPPNTPSFPNKLFTLTIGTFAALILAILIILFIEKSLNNFLSGRQLEENLNYPCYALIPKIKKDNDKPIADYVMDHPSSPTAEAVRALRLVLKLRADADKDANAQDSKVITITSSLPNEGKTTLSSWIARLAAKSGERVILIDADLRRPSIHKHFGQQNTLSLVEYLGNHNKIEEVINTNDKSGLHIIYGRSVPNSALDLTSSDKMEQLIRSLRKAYDLIIIDSPACMAASDARALEKLSDQLLYIVQWNKTSREVVHNGISQFSQFSNARIATVLTNIDLKKHVQFGYGNAISDYSNYKECPAL